MNEYHVQWILRLIKLHREFYRSAWFARRRYERLLYQQQQILNNNHLYN